MGYISKEDFISFPEGMKKIVYNEDYINASKIVLPTTTIEIDARAFEGFTELTDILIPLGVKKIGDCAFKDCKKLKRIVLPNSLEQIGYQIFVGCTSLRELVISKEFEEGIRELLDSMQTVIVKFIEE